MKKVLDCRGLACPHPVLRTKEILDAGAVAEITVTVDNPAAVENVSRFLERAGYEVQVSDAAGASAVTGRLRVQGASAPAAAWGETATRKILVLVGTDRLGTGDDGLGKKLLGNFLATLKEMGPDLWCVVLLNAGVQLSVADSEVLAALRDLAAAGVMLLVCGTCLTHFGLLEDKAVGETTNMLDIVTHLQLADKVITLT